MAADPAPSRLDPAALDAIVGELDLREAGALERWQLWYRDLLRSAWDWIKTATGGDGGWLDRATRWIGDLMQRLPGGEQLDAEAVLSGLTWLTVSVLVIGMGYLGWMLYRLYRPVPVSLAPLPEWFAHSALEQPLAALSAQQWAPALFHQVCRALLERDALTIPAHATNQALAVASKLPPDLAQRMQQLAHAADRALFAGWTPDAQALKALEAHRDAIINAVPADR